MSESFHQVSIFIFICDGKDKDAKTGNPQKGKVVWEMGEIPDRLACLDAAEMKTFSCCCFTTAFLKLWSAGHKWSSGSAFVVLLDGTLVQKRQKK
jgi:hypothetical protein